MEAAFRDQQLQPTLKDKEARLRDFKEKREIIARQEWEIDEFVDKSHSLLHASGIERIKPLISQISNRYVELFSTKESYIYHSFMYKNLANYATNKNRKNSILQNINRNSEIKIYA